MTTMSAAASLSVLLEKEATTHFCLGGYLDQSDDPSMAITADDRMKLVDWCYSIVDHCQYSREIVAMAMDRVDQFLSMPSFTTEAAQMGDAALHCKGTYQLLVMAALHSSIKAKVADTAAKSMDTFAAMCCSIHSVEEIERVERILRGEMSSTDDDPTAYQVGHSIFSLLVPYVNLPEATWSFLIDEMQYQTELAVRDYHLSTQRTSTIALAAVSNAIDSINHKPHREVICTFLARVIDCFDFDHASSISSAMQKLQCNLKECSQSHPTIQPVAAGGGKTPHPVTSQPAKSAAAYPCPLNNTITKPMRPPTAYHIFLAIEREFIIQTMDGEEADKSMHDNKVYLDYVPERYRHIKLAPDWYFRPGKKAKRKHRKQHGKIGFRELIELVSSRWAKLSETDPEVKKFVQEIADQQLQEYRLDMAEYKKLSQNVDGVDMCSPSPNNTKTKRKQPDQSKSDGEVKRSRRVTVECSTYGMPRVVSRDPLLLEI